jgi:hypothetical protein
MSGLQLLLVLGAAIMGGGVTALVLGRLVHRLGVSPEQARYIAIRSFFPGLVLGGLPAFNLVGDGPAPVMTLRAEPAEVELGEPFTLTADLKTQGWFQSTQGITLSKGPPVVYDSGATDNTLKCWLPTGENHFIHTVQTGNRASDTNFGDCYFPTPGTFDIYLTVKVSGRKEPAMISTQVRIKAKVVGPGPADPWAR